MNTDYVYKRTQEVGETYTYVYIITFKLVTIFVWILKNFSSFTGLLSKQRD
jgi:hypothetical protein